LLVTGIGNPTNRAGTSSSAYNGVVVLSTRSPAL